MPENAYLATDEETGACVLIDPGFINSELRNAVAGAASNLKGILLTHGHWDHIAKVAELQKMTGAKLYIHREDAPFLRDANLNLSLMITGEPLPALQADVLLEDGDEIPVGKSTLRVIHTPGHTVGSCTFQGDGVLFTGDTLFCESAGRTDFPTGSFEALVRSLHALMALEGDYRVYPGHECETTLAHERRNNPFV